jgi:ATP-dependent exoDNAse (exonuclease V) alpha subunit
LPPPARRVRQTLGTGRQFEVASYATVLPATVAGIQKYLGSGLIKGIGPVMAERMVAHFGVDVMHVIEDQPGRLIEVGGLGPKRTAMIAAAWAGWRPTCGRGRGWCARRSRPRPCPIQQRPHRRSPPSTCRPSSATRCTPG